MYKRRIKRYCGTALVWAGIILLAVLTLPATSFLFAAAVAMIVVGYSLSKKYRWR